MKKIVTLGELMLRLTPPRGQPMKNAQSLNIYYGGAEANVATACSNLGNEAGFISTVPANPAGEAAIRFLNGEGVKTEHIHQTGERLGIYFVEEGTAERPMQVTYDRKFSSFSAWTGSDVDWDKAFMGTDIFHVTGVTLALNENCRMLALRAVHEAKAKNIKVSFDFNYRKKLWEIEEAKAAFEQILPFVDICFGSPKDIHYILGYPTEPKGQEYDQKDIDAFMNDYQIEWFAISHRETFSNSHHRLSGSLLGRNGQTYTSPAFDVNVLDRIGGGDAFAAGLLDQLSFEQENNEKTITFAVATGVLQHTLHGDAFTLTRESVAQFLAAQSGTGVIR